MLFLRVCVRVSPCPVSPTHPRLLRCACTPHPLLSPLSFPSLPTATSPPPVDRVRAKEVQWGAVVLPDLTTLVGDLLPHEFEGLLGAVLTLSRFVLLPDPLPDTRFFSYWADAGALVRAAAAAVDRVAVVKPQKKQGVCTVLRVGVEVGVGLGVGVGGGVAVGVDAMLHAPC
jgi:hypothetical protein